MKKNLIISITLKMKLIKNLTLQQLRGIVLDGEVISDDFQNLMKQIHRKTLTK